jgi:hypothetical protein
MHSSQTLLSGPALLAQVKQLLNGNRTLLDKYDHNLLGGPRAAKLAVTCVPRCLMCSGVKDLVASLLSADQTGAGAAVQLASRASSPSARLLTGSNFLAWRARQSRTLTTTSGSSGAPASHIAATPSVAEKHIGRCVAEPALQSRCGQAGLWKQGSHAWAAASAHQ